MEIGRYYEQIAALVLPKLQGAHLRSRGGGRHLQGPLRSMRSKDPAHSERKKSI